MADAVSSPKQPIGVFALFQKSAELVESHLKLFVIVNLIPIIVTIAQAAPDTVKLEDGKLQTMSGTALSGLASGIIISLVLAVIVGSVISTLLSFFLSMQAPHSKKITFGDIWEPYRNLGLRLFMLFLAMTFLILAGLILFVVPGIILLRRYYLAPYVLIDQKCSISEALSRSAQLSKPYKGAVWSLIVLSLVISLFSLFPPLGTALGVAFGIAFSVAGPLRYFELKKLSPVK